MPLLQHTLRTNPKRQVNAITTNVSSTTTTTVPGSGTVQNIRVSGELTSDKGIIFNTATDPQQSSDLLTLIPSTATTLQLFSSEGQKMRLS